MADDESTASSVTVSEGEMAVLVNDGVRRVRVTPCNSTRRGREERTRVSGGRTTTRHSPAHTPEAQKTSSWSNALASDAWVVHDDWIQV